MTIARKTHMQMRYILAAGMFRVGSNDSINNKNKKKLNY